MEVCYWALLAACALVALAALARLWSVRRGIREVAAGLAEKMQTETNTLLCLSTGDRAVRALASEINTQLQALRAERLRLQHGDAALKAAITNISHDLRTPLTAIRGYLELLEQEPLPPDASRYLAIVQERTQAMCGLTDELFQYTLLAAQADSLTPAPLCLRDALEQSLAAACPALERQGITPVIELPECPVPRCLDGAALRRVFDNLLANAVKYAAGDLRVRLTPDGTVTFTNPAPQLTRVQAARLFDRFFTVETARRSTGLGLSIAKLLTERMGGRIAATYQSGQLTIRLDFPA